MVYHNPGPDSPPVRELEPAPTPPPPLDTFAARLRYALALRSIPAHRAGPAAGLSRAAVGWMLSREGSPSVATAAALADSLDVSRSWLAWGDGPAPAPVRALEPPQELEPPPLALPAMRPAPPATWDAFRPVDPPAAVEVRALEPAPVRAAEHLDAPAEVRASSRRGEGRWNLAPAETVAEVRAAIEGARARGVSGRRVAALAGVSSATITNATHAAKGGRGLTIEAAAAILGAVRALEPAA